MTMEAAIKASRRYILIVNMFRIFAKIAKSMYFMFTYLKCNVKYDGKENEGYRAGKTVRRTNV